MDSSMYDMLVGHEVSHALHTPCDGWGEWVGEGPDAPLRKMALNIVEDARIERMIKAQFPGIRRDFAAAYKTMHQNDIFEIKNKNLNELPLIDRLNLHFKLGLFGYVAIIFSADEKVMVERMANSKTFEEVLAIADDLVTETKQQQEQQQEQQQKQTMTEDENGEPMMSMDSSDDDGDNEGEGEGDGENKNDNTPAPEGEKNEDEGAFGDSDDLRYEDYSNAPGQTQREFERGVKQMRHKSKEDESYHYHTLPDFHLENIIVSPKAIAKMWRDTDEQSIDRRTAQYFIEGKQTALNNLTKFQREIGPTVNHMVQQFQMKQAADADKRTSISKTGILDTVSMIDYRWSEDIFLKNEIHADGKNHGIVMFVDWSGSMGNIIEDTVRQLLILVEFCRKVGIPYEVYAFSSNVYHPNVGPKERHIAAPEGWVQFTKTDNDLDVTPHSFSLYNYLSSNMTNRDHKQAVTNLWVLTSAIQFNSVSIQYPALLDLGCTPLNECIVAAVQIVPNFQRRNDVQVINTVFLTDGEGHGMGLHRCASWRVPSNNFLRDKKTRALYPVEQGSVGETKALLDMLRDRTGATIIGIRLHDSTTLKHMRYRFFPDENPATDKLFEDSCAQFRKQKYATVVGWGYDSLFIVQGKVSIQTDALEHLEDDASYTKIKNAFMRGTSSKKISRVIAGRIVDLIA